jgi:hypothetical protein
MEEYGHYYIIILFLLPLLPSPLMLSVLLLWYYCKDSMHV